MKKKVSIKDIAKELGVSITTVSFVLNGLAEEKHISKALSERVFKLTRELNYKPNQFARGLRTGKTKTIGLMVEDISNSFFSTIARLIEENAYKKGYKIIYCSTDNDTQKTKELIQMFRSRNIDGYIITPPVGIEDDIQALLDDKLPVVLFDRYFQSISTDYVIIDNQETTYQAIKHLFQQGYKNVAFVTLNSEQTQMSDRLNGYKMAVKEVGGAAYIKKIGFHYNKEQVIQSIMAYLNKYKKIDAIFFATNYLAYEGLEAINRIKLTMPGDIGFMSFDDNTLFQLYKPTISAVAQPVEEISLKVIDLLLRKLDFPEKSTEKLVLSGKLMIRESTSLSLNEPINSQIISMV